MTLIQFYLGLAVVLIVFSLTVPNFAQVGIYANIIEQSTFVGGMVRMFLVRDRVARLVAMNVVGAGTLLFLIALAARTDPVDPVLTALVITGLVITVAFTAVGALLISRIEEEP